MTFDEYQRMIEDAKGPEVSDELALEVEIHGGASERLYDLLACAGRQELADELLSAYPEARPRRHIAALADRLEERQRARDAGKEERE